jgi:(4S)-4-hydroxy-5-phosphonooxypentane-2,3-dione isomerase
MIVTIVNVWVKPEFIADFIRACEKNHLNSIKEPGNLRFDILQDASDYTKFTLYEAYESEEASIAHKSTAHYFEWRDTVANWMTKPREGFKHFVVCPNDKSGWQKI